MEKKELLMLGAGVIAGFILAKLFSGSDSVNNSDKDAEYFAFVNGGVKLGDKGNDVNRLKTVMNKFGYELPIDGLYDRATKTVITKALKDTYFINNRRNEGEVDIRFVNGMEDIFKNANI